MARPRPKRICPACGSRDVQRIEYGYPDEELRAAARTKNIVLGGCIFEGDSPTRMCGACGETWGQLLGPLADDGAPGRE